MSGRLGTIPYPQAQDEPQSNPLERYKRELDPLSRITDPLWQTPATPPLSPIRQPTPSPSIMQPYQDVMARYAGPGGVPTPSTVGPAPGAVGPAEAAGAGGPQVSSAEQLGGVLDEMGQGAGGGLGSAQLARRRASDVATAPGSATLAQTEAMPGARAPSGQTAEGGEVSTRIPSEAAARSMGIDPHMNDSLLVGMEPYMRPEVGKLRERHAGQIRGYGGIVGVHPDMTADQVAEAFVNHLTGNVRGLHDVLVDHWGRPIVQRSSRWYDGFNNIARATAAKHGYRLEQAVGGFAALSPQRPWPENVTQGERVAETERTAMDVKGATGRGTFTPQMKDWAKQYVDGMPARAKKDPESQAFAQKKAAIWRDKFHAIENVPYAQLKTNHERAMWVRAYDEAHRSRNFPIVGPDGEKYDLQLEDNGQPSRHSWGSFDEIANSIKALRGSHREVSEAVGGAHKVRSFFNNGYAPNSPRGHVTSDTHAIAVGLLRPLGSKALEVAHGLGSPTPKGIPGASGHEGTGLVGMYPMHHEAYQRASSGLWLPRQMQSITWEGGRQLFSDVVKRDKTFAAKVRNIWKEAAAGKYSSAEARAKIIALATKETNGKIPLPDWARARSR